MFSSSQLLLWTILLLLSCTQGMYPINVDRGGYISCDRSCDHTGLATPPPEVPPPEIVDRLTLSGSVPLEYYYVDDSNKGKGNYSA